MKYNRILFWSQAGPFYCTKYNRIRILSQHQCLPPHLIYADPSAFTESGWNAKVEGNSKYKRLTGFIRGCDYTKDSDNTGTIIIMGDGQELFRKDGMRGGDVPIKVGVDVSGVLKLQIKFEATLDDAKRLDLVLGEAKLIN